MFDDLIIKMSKEKPRVLFLPTASKDSVNKYLDFKEIYEREYDAIVEALFLTKEKKDNLKQYVSSFDVIYIGGGNTSYMLDIFYKTGMDKALKEAFDNGILLAGISAGAICFFNEAYTDSFTYSYNFHTYNYKMIKGLSFLPFSCCPHYDIDDHETFNDDTTNGIALENNTAFVLNGSKWRIVRDDSHHAYFVKDIVTVIEDKEYDL